MQRVLKMFLHILFKTVLHTKNTPTPHRIPLMSPQGDTPDTLGTSVTMYFSISFLLFDTEENLFSTASRSQILSIYGIPLKLGTPFQTYWIFDTGKE
jgi:hypothetical protein